MSPNLHHVRFLKCNASCRIAATVNQSEVMQSREKTVDLSAMAYPCRVQVDSLERDAFEVLSLVQFIKNSFAPVNRIPPEILSLIPDYYHEDDADQGVITLTHVCRRWRDTFTSCSSLWTQLDFKNVDKTRVFIQRSKSSLLTLCLDYKSIDDALALMIPHVHRLKSLTIRGVNALQRVIEHFRCHAPLLEKLNIGIFSKNEPTLDGALFNGDLSFLRELRLSGVITPLPWKNLVNLRVVNLDCRYGGCGVTRLLNLFESAPLLHTVTLRNYKVGSFNAPPGRIVPLRHLRSFHIDADTAHSNLLPHIHIPIGATLVSSLCIDCDDFPLLDLDYLPERFPNLANLSHITTINLSFFPALRVQLSGPSGRLRVLVWQTAWTYPAPYDNARHALRSFSRPMLSTIQRLVVSRYIYSRSAEVEGCPVFKTLSSMNSLRTLVLIRCNDLHFTLALDPEQNPRDLMLCPNMEELVVCIHPEGEFHVRELIRMVKNRASRGAKLLSVKIVSVGVLVAGEEVEELREHVVHAEYLVDNKLPHWDGIDW